MELLSDLVKSSHYRLETLRLVEGWSQSMLMGPFVGLRGGTLDSTVSDESEI